MTLEKRSTPEYSQILQKRIIEVLKLGKYNIYIHIRNSCGSCEKKPNWSRSIKVKVIILANLDASGFLML